MNNIVLFLVSHILFIILYPFGLLIGMYRGGTKYLLQCAITVDQSGNVFCQHIFNLIFITSKGYRFGNPDETISSVLGKNQLNGTLSLLGKAMNHFLSFLDPNHSIDAIEHDKDDLGPSTPIQYIKISTPWILFLVGVFLLLPDNYCVAQNGNIRTQDNVCSFLPNLNYIEALFYSTLL